MNGLVQTMIAGRKIVRSAVSPLIIVAIAFFLVVDIAWQLDNRWRYPVVAFFGIVLVSAIRGVRHDRDNRSAATRIRWIELTSLCTVGLLGLAIYVDGNLDGPVYPTIYVWFVLVSALTALPVTVITIAIGLSVEAIIRFFSFHQDSAWPMITHGVFAAAFAVLGTVVVKTEMNRVKNLSVRKLQAEIERIHSSARAYRLLATTARAEEPLGSSESDQHDNPARLVQSSVEEIHQAVFFAIDLLRKSLGLNTAMLLWLSDNGTHFRISELSTDSEQVLEGPFPINEGIFGAMTSQEGILSLCPLKSSYSLPYYNGLCPVQSVIVVPVLEQQQLRGVLVADRVHAEPFTETQQQLLVAATRYMLRAIQNERVFVQLERAKVEQGKLYRAAKALGAAMTERDVVEASVRSAREVACFDFAAVTLYDETKKIHVIRAVSGSEEAHKLVGNKFRHNTGLVSMVVQNCHPLPYRGQFDPGHHVVFTPRLKPPPMPSMLVLPLLVHDRPLGALVLGSSRTGALGESVRPTLEVLASHVAVSLSGARMMRRLEELATRDGLTGLFNKRALLEMASSKIASAIRFATKLSVLIVDIDHFKKVNDTYGHDQGDVVLKGLGNILKKAKRTTDAVARFGGEEFVIMCEQTDKQGAFQLAERIREQLSRTSFLSPMGEIVVTCSVGIATCPDVATDWESLFKAADEALYVSKRSGRNRCTVWTHRRDNAA